jgi:hypothetical protein
VAILHFPEENPDLSSAGLWRQSWPIGALEAFSKQSLRAYGAFCSDIGYLINDQNQGQGFLCRRDKTDWECFKISQQQLVLFETKHCAAVSIIK